jgi:hypothetical protein
MKAKDKLGHEIRVGDTVAYATKGYSGARLKSGLVKKVNFKEVVRPFYNYDTKTRDSRTFLLPKISVQLITSGGYVSNVTLGKLDRIVVIHSVEDEILREHLSEYGKFVFDRRKAEGNL